MIIWNYREYIRTLCNPFEDYCPANALEPYNGEEIYCGDIDSRRGKILETADKIMKYLKDTEYYKDTMFSYNELIGKGLTQANDLDIFMRRLNFIVNSIDGKMGYRKRIMSRRQKIEQSKGEEEEL